MMSRERPSSGIGSRWSARALSSTTAGSIGHGTEVQHDDQ
jgi:hypothetical protein